MGLLGNGWDDPQSQAIMALSGGLLSANGSQGLGAGLLGASQAMQAAKAQALKEQILRMQMERQQFDLDRAQREDRIEQSLGEAAKGAYRSPETATAMSMGPTRDGSLPPNVAPGFDAQGFLQKAYGISPMRAMQFEQSLAKDNTPITVAPGASLVDKRTFQPLFTAPKEKATPSAIQEYEFAQSQGYRGSYEQWTKEQKKAGASNTSISVNTEKSLLNDIAGGLGKSITEAKGQAQAALSTINTVNRLNDALDSGKTMAGPGTTFRQYGLQIGNVLGVTGKDAQEKMLNTRQAIQSLAQLELDAAQQMKGQGQITEAERAIIRRAASGDVDSMTTGELRLLGGILDRTARSKIRGFNQQVAPLKNNPNAAPLVPFLDVAEPEARKPAAGVLRFDAQGNLIQ
jgi:hypothetical protein